MQSLLAFVAILKDEAPTIRKTLESVKPYVDAHVVLDTGSTDNTRDIVEEYISVGSLYEEPFVDFAASRNRVLELQTQMPGPPLVFSLMLSGDEELVGGKALREYLETQRNAPEGAYCIEIRAGSQSWYYPRVFRTGAGWQYEGAVHEMASGPKGERVGPLIPGAYILHTVSDPERRARRMREFDLPTLTKIVEDESQPLYARANSIFHLAETYTALAAECKPPRDPGSPWLLHQMTAMAFYFRYAMLAEDPLNPARDEEKAVFAYFRFYSLAEAVGLYTHEELLTRLEALAQINPRLPEIRFMIAVHAAQIDARKGLFLAQEAARVANAAKAHPSYLPTDSRIEWMACRIAADCAQVLKMTKCAQDFAKQGIAAGGNLTVFAEYV